jgi:hypothetical protein
MNRAPDLGFPKNKIVRIAQVVPQPGQTSKIFSRILIYK